jgi:hypothetical protein
MNNIIRIKKEEKLKDGNPVNPEILFIKILKISQLIYRLSCF